jgi:hypothetical protein
MKITKNTGIFVLAVILLLTNAIMPVVADDPPSTPTAISCTVSSTTVTLGDDLVVSGSISPTVSGVTVTLTYSKPDATNLVRTIVSEIDGSFQDIYTPDVTGSWKVKANWLGNADYLGATSFNVAFEVVNSAVGIPVELLAAAALIIIVIVALIYWYKKKR